MLAVVSLVFYRNWKYEQELDSLLWKVDYKDIEINDTENSSTSSKISRVSDPENTNDTFSCDAAIVDNDNAIIIPSLFPPRRDDAISGTGAVILGRRPLVGG